MGQILMAGGIGLSALAQIRQGQAAEAAGKYEQQLEENRAREVEQKARFESRRQAEEGERVISSMEAGYGASGAGINLLALARQRAELNLENLMIGREGRIGAAEHRQRGKIAKWYGKETKRQAYLQAAATALGGSGGMAWGAGWGSRLSAASQGVPSRSAATVTGRTSSGGYVFG